MKNKKVVAALLIILIISTISIIGFTMAYFTSQTQFDNEFNTALYQTEATETFTSPENWLPGDETPKTLTITNTGNVDVKARVCIDETWESDNGDSLPLEQNGERVAIINLDNTSDWTKKGNCYEYNETLEPNDVTSSFIESVTFNPNIDISIPCEQTVSNGSITSTCESTGNGYDNAKYTLKLTVETIQANAASQQWAMITKYSINTNSNEIYLNSDVTNYMDSFYDTFEEAIEDFKLPFCLKYILYNNRVVERYVEFEISEERAQTFPGATAGKYLLKGDIDETNATTKEVYEANKQTMTTAFGSSRCQDNYMGNNNYVCSVINATTFLSARVTPSGWVNVLDDSEWYCSVDGPNDTSHCDM